MQGAFLLFFLFIRYCDEKESENRPLTRQKCESEMLRFLLNLMSSKRKKKQKYRGCSYGSIGIEEHYEGISRSQGAE